MNDPVFKSSNAQALLGGGGGGSFKLIGPELCDLTALTCAGSSPFKSVHQPQFSWTPFFFLVSLKLIKNIVTKIGI